VQLREQVRDEQDVPPQGRWDEVDDGLKGVKGE
jgi:hypothetical protein